MLLQFNVLCPQMDMTPYFEHLRKKPKTVETQPFLEQPPGTSLKPLCNRTKLFSSWESRLPRIVKMIAESDADVVCLQEVQCSNVSAAALNSDSSKNLIGRHAPNVTEDEADKIKRTSASLIERVISLLSPVLVENPDNFDREKSKMSNMLKGKVIEPATTQDLTHLKMFYEEPSRRNVKIVVVKKIKIPIFVDTKQIKGKQTRTADELLHEANWLKSIAHSDKPVDQRRCDLLRDYNGCKLAVPKGSDYFLLVVIKSGTVCEGCQLEYVLPELPIYSRTPVTITVKRIIDLNYHDETEKSGQPPLKSGGKAQGGGKAKKEGAAAKDGGKAHDKAKKEGVAAKDGAKVRCVESMSVKGCGFESVALIQVMPPPLHKTFTARLKRSH